MKKLLVISALLFALSLTGCAFLDKATGVDDESGEPSMIERVSEGAKDALPWPWGLIVGAVGGSGAIAYRNVRKAQKAKETVV